MAIVNRQEFAEMCGIDNDQVRSYISRKKIITCDQAGNLADGGKFIDTDNPLNKAFKQQRKAKAGLKKEEADIIRQVAMSGPAPKFEVPKAGKFKVRPHDPEASDEENENDIPPGIDEELIYQYQMANRRSKGGNGGGDDPESLQKWITMKLKGDAILVTLKGEREKLLVEKAAGKLIPVDLVTNIHRNYCTWVFNGFESRLEIMASKYCEILGGGNQSLYTRVLEEIRNELETCIQEAGVAANEDIKRIITNFSQSRNLVN